MISCDETPLLKKRWPLIKDNLCYEFLVRVIPVSVRQGYPHGFLTGLTHVNWGSEFSNYEIELRNRVTQNDIKLRVPNSNIFTEILLSSYSKVYLLFFYFRVTNSNLRNNKFHFQLLTRRLNFYFFNLELLTRSWKIKIYTSSY